MRQSQQAPKIPPSCSNLHIHWWAAYSLEGSPAGLHPYRTFPVHNFAHASTNFGCDLILRRNLYIHSWAAYTPEGSKRRMRAAKGQLAYLEWRADHPTQAKPSPGLTGKTRSDSTGKTWLGLTGTAAEPKRNTLKGFQDFYLKAKARIWP